MEKLENQHGRSQVISIVKSWASPALIAVIGMLLWRDLSELRSDVKILLEQSYIDKTRIDQLERRLESLEDHYWKRASNNSKPEVPVNQKQPAIKPEQLNLSSSKRKPYFTSL